MSSILLDAGTGQLEIMEFIVENRLYAINVLKLKGKLVHRRKWTGKEMLYDEENQNKEYHIHTLALENGDIDIYDFTDAIKEYRLPIEQSLASKNPFVRMFAVLDRRVGRRTLKKNQNREKNSQDG